jgi:hypothetical protein
MGASYFFDLVASDVYEMLVGRLLYARIRSFYSERALQQ